MRLLTSEVFKKYSNEQFGDFVKNLTLFNLILSYIIILQDFTIELNYFHYSITIAGLFMAKLIKINFAYDFMEENNYFYAEDSNAKFGRFCYFSILVIIILSLYWLVFGYSLYITYVQ